MAFLSVLAFAHKLVGDTVRRGECVIDATAGGGNDTAFLARCVGPGGTVYAFDIQLDALRRTEERLVRGGLAGEEIRIVRENAREDVGRAGGNPARSGLAGAGRNPLRSSLAGAGVWLIQESHHRMADLIPEDVRGRAAAVMFNLGYLPGGDQRIITRAATTLPALDAAAALLRPDGVLTCVVYPGHEGGGEEAEAVERWAADLDPVRFQAITYRMINRRNRPPYLIGVRRIGGEGT